MDKLLELFDSYNRKARLFPAIIACAPVILTALVWTSVWKGTTGLQLIPILFGFGGLYALSVYARSRGKAAEVKLVKLWGGWPTTIQLRHRDTTIPTRSKLRYHAYFATQRADLRLPTAAEEQQDPDAADDAYADAINWLRQNRRGVGYKVILENNADYGFRRNLWGLKRAATILILVAIAGWWLALASRQGISPFAWPADPKRLLLKAPEAATLALAVNLLALILWWTVITKSWVRQAADQYATSLIESCDAPGGGTDAA